MTAMWQLGHRDEDALAAAWRAATPFPYVVIDDVVPAGDLMEVLDEEGVARYEADLFAFEASPPNGLADLRVRFAEALAPLLSRVTGKPVTRADMRAFAYRPGHYLLPHTDHQAGLERLLAYAYYLPSPEPPRGGELELYRCELKDGELAVDRAGDSDRAAAVAARRVRRQRRLATSGARGARRVADLARGMVLRVNLDELLATRSAVIVPTGIFARFEGYARYALLDRGSYEWVDVPVDPRIGELVATHTGTRRRCIASRVIRLVPGDFILARHDHSPAGRARPASRSSSTSHRRRAPRSCTTASTVRCSSACRATRAPPRSCRAILR